MKRVSLYGDIIYADGWFAYIENNGKCSPLTRVDARQVELDYRLYNARMDIDRGGMQPSYAYSARGIAWNETKKTFEVNGPYWVDELAPVAQDVVISDELVIPENIGGYKMNHMYMNSFQKLDIEKLVVPESITGIASGAFNDCKALKEVQFGSRLDIAGDAFVNCPFVSFQDGVCYISNTLFKATDNVNKNLVIPDNVTSISDRAFEGNKTLETVIIPDGCNFIGVLAFSGCSMLKEISFAGKVDKICDSAFENCPQLEKVELPEGITQVPRNLFKDCTKLSEVTIPSTVTTVGVKAFVGTEMEKRFLDSDEKCMYIGNWLIRTKKYCGPELIVRDGTVGIAENCSRCGEISLFRKVHLPQSVKYLNSTAFEGTQFEELELGGVEDIGLDAIRGNRCKVVHIPATCKRLTYWNFNDCPNIKDIYFHSPDTFIEWPAITDRRDKATIRIHGALGSTAQAYCREYGDKYNLKFVEL